MIMSHAKMNYTDNATIDLVHSEEDNPAKSLYQMCATLYAKSELVDCTISCRDGHLQAHRIVLASASSYLSNLLTSTPLPTPCSHPILFLRNSSLADAKCAMEYVYTGKTQTSINRLAGLLEVSQELGLAPLLKAIESAIQTVGGSGFQTLRGSPNQNQNAKPSSSNSSTNSNASPISSPIIDRAEKPEGVVESSPPRPGEHNGIITVKTDIFDEPEEDYEDDEEEDLVAQDMSFLTASRNNNVNNINSRNLIPSYDSTKNNNNKRPAPAAISKVPNGNNPNKQFQSQTWKVPRMLSLATANGMNGIKLENNHQSSSNSGPDSSAELGLQHDKGESFVYTNADFKAMEQEEDENESGGDGEGEPEVPQSIANINELLKGEFKDEETSLPASCPWCMQVFTNLALFQKHIRSHVSNYRPFSCDYCHNTFARSAHLKRHLRTHTGEKPYVCQVCQRPFARQDKLKTHMERHLQNAAKPLINPMTMTSYPPVALSQNSGGQVPIKVLLPLGKQMNGSPSTYKPFNNNNNNSLLSSSNNRFGLPTSTNNGLSISIANSPAVSESQRSLAGGLIVTPANMPGATTITPISNLNAGGGGGFSNDFNKRTKSNTPISHNFLVK